MWYWFQDLLFAKRDLRMYSRKHAIVTLCFDYVHRRDLRRFRATSPYVTQTIYRLKYSRFPHWNRLANYLSCPHPGCSPRDYAPASHVFWFCPLAQRRWRILFEVWSRIGRLADTDLSHFVFSLKLPKTPDHAWHIALAVLPPNDRNVEARAVVFDTVNE